MLSLNAHIYIIRLRELVSIITTTQYTYTLETYYSGIKLSHTLTRETPAESSQFRDREISISHGARSSTGALRSDVLLIYAFNEL